MDEKELRNLARLAKYALRATEIQPYIVSFSYRDVRMQGKFDSRVILNTLSGWERGLSGGFIQVIRVVGDYRIILILTE